MNILNNILILLGLKKITKQTDSSRIGMEVVRELIVKSFGVKVDYHNSDTSYKLVNIDALKDFLASDMTNRRVYIKNNQDCDDFAFILQGEVTKWDSDLAFGIVWGQTPEGGGHAVNWFIDTNQEIWFVEPQNDKIYKPDGWKVSFMVM